MKYSAALEEEDHTQAERIIDIEASVDSQTVLAEANDYTASAVTTVGPNKDLKDLSAIMKQLRASVTAQATILAALSVKTNSGGGGGGGKNTK